MSLAKLTHFTTRIFDVREFEVNVSQSVPEVTLDFLLTDRERTVLTFGDRLPAPGFIDILIQVRFEKLSHDNALYLSGSNRCELATPSK